MARSLSTKTAISTGSRNLNKLIYSSSSTLPRISHASVIPSDISLPIDNGETASSNDATKSKRRRVNLKIDEGTYFGKFESSGSGVEFGKVTELTGESATGKSQITMTTACMAAFKNVTVHYILSRNGSTKSSTVRRFLRISHLLVSKSNIVSVPLQSLRIFSI